MSFKSYGRPGSFKPIQVPDESKKILDQGQRDIQGMRAVQKADMENQTSINNTITRSNQIEQNNRQRNFELAQQNIQNQRDSAMQQFEVAQERASARSETEAKNMQAIANISATAFNGVQNFLAEREKGKQEAYTMAVYEFGVTTDEAVALTKVDTNLSENNFKNNSTVRSMLDRGVPLDTIKFLSRQGRGSSGYVNNKALVQNTIAQAPLAFEAMKDEKFKVGEELITYNEALEQGELEKLQNIQRQMERKYITKDSQLINVSPELLGTQVFPELRSYWKRENGFAMKQVRETMKAKAEEEIMTTFQTQYTSDGISGAWGLVETANDKRGARNDFFKWAQESAESGSTNLTFSQIAGEKVTIGGKTRTIQEWYGRTDEFQDMKKAFEDKRKLDRYQRTEAFEELKVEFQEAQQEVIDYLMSQPNLTQKMVDDAKMELMNKFGGFDPTKLDNIVISDDRLLAQQEAEVREMAKDGSLTLSELSKYDYRIFRKFRDVAIRYSEAGAKTNNYETQIAAIKDLVKNQSFVKVLPDGTTNPTVRLKAAQLTRQFNKTVAERLQAAGPGADPIAIADQVYREIYDSFNAQYGNASPELKGRLIKEGYFDVFNGTQPASEAKRELATKMNAIDQAFLKDANQALNTPNLIVDEAAAEVLTSTYGQPGWKPGAPVTYAADRLGITPLHVINSQLEALNQQGANHELLKPTPSQEAIQKNVRPDVRRILEQYQTPERSTRGLGSSGKWMREVVPHGLGEFVEQASQANGVMPWDLAALAEIESNWNVNAVSKVGASGMMQVMKEFFPDYDLNNKDPEYQLDFGAKIYSQLLKQFGDPVIAAGAYNAGPNRMLEYLETGRPLPAETVEHMKRFKIKQYKYGKKDVLQDPQVMRPSSPVAVYITGNIGPTSTGPHLDVKKVGGGRFEETALDDYVEVEDPEFGRISLGELRQRTGGVGDNWQEHYDRGSHGIDYGTHSGTPVYLKNGAKKIGSRPSEHGDVVTIELPTGEQYTFLHGTKS